MNIPGKSSRPYATEKRDAKAAETRARLVAAALAILGEPGGHLLSLDAVARAAGVTRLTVYNQFGSRNGLLEAAFDAIAERGNLASLAEAMAIAEPRAALARVVRTFCDFWMAHDGLGGIFAAAAMDAELGAALAARNERRRALLGVLVDRQGVAGGQAKADLVDLLFTLTSFATFSSLRGAERDGAAVCALLLPLCDRILSGAAG
ncbi:TetR/AcrR family transcriptional regulator [Sphingomonas sp. CBMAI 2297]|uniref:TetR/AcrR family transcriptional regulator n=1 Tax=Sphingomonas sp. CBMAI 2297 TaxID=2991720 RepID=UPI0024553078|nr:TetR/AcrR family transcriptional regulator [Sphingomonas sp. CBMAI 2297]MDH4743462.1 TetR/AcrR family transcriptional regulator [Sphingomonas sp. CBMAI 2297]